MGNERKDLSFGFFFWGGAGGTIFHYLLRFTTSSGACLVLSYLPLTKIPQYNIFSGLFPDTLERDVAKNSIVG